MSKTVVVTGAGSGIGKAIATVAAQRDWRVVVTDIDLDAATAVAAGLDDPAGLGHEATQLDVTDPAQAAMVADDIADRLGLDAWMSNAGISFMVPFLDVSLDNYDLTMDINLKGVFICGQAAARAMVRTGRRGTIVNTASMAGKQGRVPYLSDYVASKHGVVGLTQAMAYELAEHGITVNCVCPGFVATPMQSRELDWEAQLRGTTPEKVKQMWIDDTPLGRLQQPEDVAYTVAFLLSDDARFITGEALAVNGGAYMD
ncbi:SDR family NAD(P)-dependent oxidoreductase [Mycolicibacterium aichiense]|uniref:3-ketoacyl-ACP reductase n=2 Tax=Mycolicibacterium TaxID=1866885 RepID=A0AAD1HM02_9MYCO|nr:SDR family NAD(P)-dependent oxidoreductase [Mycolicibacterium aichiense]MCV7019935.1 SDR family oxidoreductase [Mycolicibacterium aichiense]BBX07526.1 3-ketoacyl-ACP reductase [Mycolicibacterium aichiense]STZ81340.1 short-chain dehydrogenase/reductase SDR [Mycolicibacterium aichiense]